MAKQFKDDEYKQKFRPEGDESLDKQIDEALGEISMDELYDFDKPQPAAPQGEAAPGQKGTRRGKIVSIGKEDVFVDFGGKSQGIVSLMQFDQIPTVGEEMEFNVDRYDEREGVLVLTRKGATASRVSWETLEVGQVVEAVVTGTNKGGLELEVKGMRAFMPAGQVGLYHVPDFEGYVGQKMTAEVTQFERDARNIVLSRRNILEREKEEAGQKLMAELAEGQTRRGTVRNVMDFGAFVDLGGVDGLLHVSEMSYRRVRDPHEIVKVGDLVEVKIIRIDKEAKKLSLSLKQAMADPWSNVAEKYAVGSALTGRVSRVENFGAFIEVEEGVEGLLPVSEISWQRIGRPSDVVKEGDTLRLVVLSVDPVARRMSFSLKQAGPDPWATVHERYATGTVVAGQVSRIVDFGAFVELEPGLEGLVHISELSEQRIRSAGDVLKAGQEVRLRILEIDKEHRRISLSLKRAVEPAPASPTSEPTPASSPAKKKKRPELRGGLDF